MPTQLDSVNLQTVNEGTLVSAGYTYHSGSRRVDTLSRPLTGGAALVGASAWDAADRLKSVAWTRGSSAVAGYNYQLNSAGLRSMEIRQDGTKLEYGYNDRGELVRAVRKRTANNSLRPDWSHGYQYRDNGNRASISTPEGETLNYTFNDTSSGVNIALSPLPSKQWLRGRAHPDAEVKVGTGTAEREGDLWRYLWTNPAPPAAQQVTVAATRPSLTPGPIPGNHSWTLPAAATLFQYDQRGNLSQDAHWLYTWDAENRLVVQEQRYPGTATEGGRQVKRLEFSYDAMGRRISKKVLHGQKSGNGQLLGTWSFSKETVFIWQDWVLLAEFVRTSSGGNFELRRSYLWGLDVDGRLGGAGGVGGLLWVADYVPGQATSNRQLAPWYDGNGNVMGWMENDGAQPLPQHRLEYDPYGKLLVDDTVRPTRNKKQRDLGVSEAWLGRPAFAFSTKYEDAETGLLYYGYRYYAPEMGRWISCDPIAERGGINLHGMVGNDSINSVDRLGLDKIVIAGGTSVNDPGGHDLSGWNFLNTAVRRAKALEADIKKKGNKEEVVLIIYAPPYERRAIAEKKPLNHYLDIVRKTLSGLGVKIVEIRTKDDLTKTLVKMPSASITSLDYFGHSNKDALFLEYSSTPQTNGTHDVAGNPLPKPTEATSNDYWSGADAANVPKTQFAIGATVASYGCHQGEKGGFSELINKIWGVASQGSDGTTDYIKAGVIGGPPFPSSANGYIVYP